MPIDGDLLFGRPEDEAFFRQLSLFVLSAKETRAQELHGWTLAHRSWYGYALQRAKVCARLPRGGVESLPSSARVRLARIQVALEVPTLLTSACTPEAVQRKLPKAAGRYWLSSAAWSQLNSAERVATLEAWFRQNEVQTYESVAREGLPLEAKNELRRAGLLPWLNRFAHVSGPNCFAAAAAAISATKAEVLGQWLHWAPFVRILRERGYASIKNVPAERGDVLVWSRGGQRVHAAYYLGDDLYFEKTGQDFYEPYRVARLSRWREEWPQSTLSTYRPPLP